jgi:chorismate synthase
MEGLIKSVRKEGDTIGGSIYCKCIGLPSGLGEPVFEKLNAVIGQAMFSINAVKGVEVGIGFDSITKKGSEINDLFNSDFTTQTNNSGGIQGGISNGMPIEFRVAFKPVATIMKDQNSISESGKGIILKGKGRHDPCVVPRAVVIVESMLAIVLLDFYLRNKAYS